MHPAKVLAVKPTRHPVLKAIVFAGFVAGTIDIGAAALINWLNPVIILHAIASGVLGKASYFEGTRSALLGLFLQWGMSLLIATIYVTAARRLRWLGANWFRGGLAYGIVIFIVMNYVVVPLSAAWPHHPFTLHGLMNRFPPDKFVYNLLAMLLFGLIVAFYTHFFRVHVKMPAAKSELSRAGTPD